MRRFFALLCAALLLLGLVFVYFSPAQEGTVYEISQVMRGNFNDKFGSSRILIWRESLALFGERPLLGGGPDTLALRVDVEFSRLVEETGKIMSAQTARGADFTNGSISKRAKALIPVLIPLFISAFRRAGELATAMTCRCYRGGEGRTRMTKLTLTYRDFVALFIMAAFIAGIVLLNVYAPGYSM